MEEEEKTSRRSGNSRLFHGQFHLATGSLERNVVMFGLSCPFWTSALWLNIQDNIVQRMSRRSRSC